MTRNRTRMMFSSGRTSIIGTVLWNSMYPKAMDHKDQTKKKRERYCIRMYLLCRTQSRTGMARNTNIDSSRLTAAV